jgi:tetratricopeptide (TPR) repeat protein
MILFPRRTLPLLALFALAGALQCIGEPPVTPESCRELRKHGRQAEAASCFETLTRSTDPYFDAEGFWGLGRFDQANESFRLAAAGPNSKAIVRVRWGLLLHDRFNNSEAVDLFHEALKQDPNNAQAYLGLAQVSAEGFDSRAEEYAQKALELDPKVFEAHELLANLALENARTSDAIKEADQALALSADALQAMAVRAAAEVLADRTPDADTWLGKIRAVNPHDGEGYALVASHLVLNRRYEDGVAYYRKAIEADPQLWSARSQLGINLMRLGQEDEPLKLLEESYDNGQRDPATVNSLRLLDSYKNFVTFRDATTVLKLRKNEADLLRPYFEAELHQAMATYEKKYRLKLAEPVQLEVYPDHEDFAVRTMGMPGLGALGVTFNNVVAMDSPSGRKPGDFNWGSTMWHELSHVYILAATHDRVPRWFTEGLAVHEEGQASPAWSDRLTPEILVAIRDKKLLSVAKMDQGFIFPDYPSQVVVSYFEAGSMCDFIQQRWGDERLLDMVHSYAELKTTPQVVQADLNLSPEDFDKAYLAWLNQRVGSEPANFDTWRKALKDLAALAKVNQNDAVIKTAPGVVRLYPEYVGDANAYEFLAGAQFATGDKAAAMTTLAAYKKMGGESPQVLMRLASLQEEAGHGDRAAATLEGINYIYPELDGLHTQLGKLLLAQHNYAGAVREYTAVLALNPLDKASAEFDLANAYFAAGQKDRAEESVLLALETAPGFRPAQKLLLEIKSGGKGSETKGKDNGKPE